MVYEFIGNMYRHCFEFAYHWAATSKLEKVNVLHLLGQNSRCLLLFHVLP